MPTDSLVRSLGDRLERLEQVVHRHANELEQIKTKLIVVTIPPQKEPTKTSSIQDYTSTTSRARSCSSSELKLTTSSTLLQTGRQQRLQVQAQPASISLAVKPASHLRESHSIGHYKPQHYAPISLLDQQQQPTTPTTIVAPSLRRLRHEEEEKDRIEQVRESCNKLGASQSKKPNLCVEWFVCLCPCVSTC